jgi:fructan beta-fructosidase
MRSSAGSTRRLHWSHRRAVAVSLTAVLAACAAIVSATGSTAAAQTDPVTYRELYRPQFHFTPAKNWMNDPNGLVYYKGEYHLFYQYNPFGNTWGNISWGHAVSRDLVHWRHLPVAIPDAPDGFIFSGSAVVDYQNTSGFGRPGRPAMVAIYTRAAHQCCSQAQAIAYSLDRGRTWTKYAGNPVLDIGSGEFRDPKVFWYAPARHWIMAVVLATEHKVSFYGSANLKSWTHLSDFGPANATGGVWEVPDLFPLAVDGKRKTTKWVLIVNLNPGGIAGGSGAQYFVGDFDGTRFHADNVLGDYTPPPGELYEGFEGATYGDWTTTGNAFGSGPAAGNVPPQGGVSGYLGNGLANSFHDEDRGTGTLTSPSFEISRPYLNFLVGGGNHPHDPATTDSPPPGGTVFADFEVSEGYGEGWTATGTFAGTTAPHGTIGDQLPVSGYEGSQLVNTFIDHDNGTGHISSPEFTITTDYINFLIGGGNHPYPGDAGNPPTSVNLVIDGQVVRSSSGQDSEALNWTNWNVSELQGQTAHIDIVDENTGGWGHINADQFTFADQPAFPRSTETAVNLLVDGDVVRTATGANSETLDWTNWNVRDLIGKAARIQLVDRNTGGWGHLLADHFTFADQPALSVLQRSSWMDYGKDFYAAVTYNDVPDGRRIAIAWMNNWNYAGAIPTSPWRSAMSVPRELGLETIDGSPRLVSQPVRELKSLRSGPSYHLGRWTIQPGAWMLPLRGKTLEIKADLRSGTAERAGLKVRTGSGEETVIGYDAEVGELYVDRTRSGRVDFSRDFPGVQRAPLAARHGKVHLRILVDWSSVEVFADRGQTVITDQIFPAATSDGIQLFADGGSATIDSLKIRPLRSSWRTGHDHDGH